MNKARWNKKRKTFTSLNLLISIVSVLSVLVPVFCHAIEAKIIKVTDGDTVTAVTEDNQTLKIRLFGIDAPEKNQAYGQKSRQALSRMLNRKEVDVEIVAGDKYGRSVGIIYLGNKTINEEMIKKGHAWVYKRYCVRPECGNWINLEEEARRERKGLWDDSEPVPPWDFRHAKKNSQKKGLWDFIERVLK